LSELAVAEHCNFSELFGVDLFQNLAGRGKRFNKHSLLVADGVRDKMQILERKRQKLGERAIVRHDAKNGPSSAVRLQATFAKIASGAVTVSRAGNVNFAADSPA
jgi:hypothetical protein